MKKFLLIVLALLMIVAVGCGKTTKQDSTGENQTQQGKDNQTQQGQDNQASNNQAQSDQPPDTTGKKIVTIETAKGNIVMEIYPKEAPITVTNFETLVNKGFYNGLIFHRVEAWVTQGGDPTGTGSGGSDKTIKGEFTAKLHHDRGVVGMARSSDPDSASSQFYIVKSPARSIDGQYALFGKVTQGMEVVDKIQVGDKMTKVTIADAK